MSSPFHQDDGHIYRLVMPCGFFVLASVLFRFWAKIKTKNGISIDDWMILVAFVLYVGVWYIYLDGAIDGTTGVPFTDYPLPLLEKYLKLAWIDSVLTTLCVTFAKFSILWIYWTLFSTKGYRWGTCAIFIFCFSWGTAVSLVSLLKCIPVSSNWDILGPPGNCINFLVFFQIAESFNVLMDLALVLLPVNVIRRLQMPMRRKVLLTFVFALGLLVTIISIVRLSLFTTLDTLEEQESSDWLFVQTTLQIIVVSLPTYGPLIPKRDFMPDIRTWYVSLVQRATRSSGSRHVTHGSAGAGAGAFHGLDNASNEYFARAYPASESNQRVENSSNEYPLDSIKVKKTVEIL